MWTAATALFVLFTMLLNLAADRADPDASASAATASSTGARTGLLAPENSLGPAITLDLKPSSNAVSPLVVSTGGTTVVSNLAAGGATWEWTDRTGIQFLNNYDLGRELQSSLFLRRRDGRKLNPTEAGDRFGDPQVAPSLRHRSPAALGIVNGTRVSTLAVPLEWAPGRVDPRAGTTHPVLYTDMRLGKVLELAYRGQPDVARYQTVLMLPDAATHADLEAPTAYLRASFREIYTFDARTAALAPIKPKPWDKRGEDWTPPSGWGGLIASNASGTHAFAIYGVTTQEGGSISQFSAHDFTTPGASKGEADVATIKLRALRVGDFPAGTTICTAYIVTGTLASVQAEMIGLARAGVR
jgi:hypothetical protein